MASSISCFYGQEGIDVKALSLPVDLRAEFSHGRVKIYASGSEECRATHPLAVRPLYDSTKVLCC